MRYLTAALLLACSCAGSAPRFTDPAEQEQTSLTPVVQVADLAGELLVSPPEKRAEQVLAENPESIFPLMSMGEAPPPVTTETLMQLPDTTEVAPPVIDRGPRREYQIQVAITPSAEEAEEFKERLTPLLEGEEVFVIFTSPYYRIRVGRKPTREAADVLLRKLHDLGYTGAMVIPITITPDRDAS
jgi:hypothetical protein